jgi:transcription elongation factor SPT6
MQNGMTVHARIIKINIENFSVELTTKSSDLIDADNKWRLVTVTIVPYL